jgi:hypothetical protein
MYNLLLKLFPSKVANALMIIWYATLILLVVRWFLLSAGEFRYLNL